MLEKITATPMIAVKDVDTAGAFYKNKLGLDIEPVAEGMARCRAGKTEFLLYESDFAGTNKANAFAWSVGDQFDAVIEDLHRKGIEFEHYNLPNTQVQGDIHVSGDMKLAWFKDPDGNILHVLNG